MPVCIPESPDFTTGSERLVWERLRDSLGPGDLLVANLRVTDEAKDHELDLLVGLRGHGVVVVEVKGGVVQHRGDGWRQTSQKGGQERTIHPVDQARDGKYAARRFVETHPSWAEGHRTRVLWAHAVVLPYSQVPQDFSSPECPRWSLVDRPRCPTSSRRSGRSSTASRAAAVRRTATTSRCSQTCSGRAACHRRTCSASPSSTRTMSSA